MVNRALVDASDYIPGKRWVGGAELDSTCGTFESQRVLTKPDMILLEAVAGDRDRA